MMDRTSFRCILTTFFRLAMLNPTNLLLAPSTLAHYEYLGQEVAVSVQFFNEDVATSVMRVMLKF